MKWIRTQILHLHFNVIMSCIVTLKFHWSNLVVPMKDVFKFEDNASYIKQKDLDWMPNNNTHMARKQ